MKRITNLGVLIALALFPLSMCTMGCREEPKGYGCVLIRVDDPAEPHEDYSLIVHTPTKEACDDIAERATAYVHVAGNARGSCVIRMQESAPYGYVPYRENPTPETALGDCTHSITMYPETDRPQTITTRWKARSDGRCYTEDIR